MRHKIKTLVLLLSALIPSTFAQTTAPTTRPRFTISKETTIVDGPVRPDGTIDYVPVINDLIGHGVKNEDNAAIPLLLLSSRYTSDGKIDPTIQRALVALHAEMPTDATPTIRYFSMEHMAGKDNELPSQEESDRTFKMEQWTKEHPWKAADYPEAAAWLEASGPGLKVIEAACLRPAFYLPFLEETAGKTILDGMPESGLFNIPRDLLAARAMCRAGAGDVGSALEDLRRIRVLARLGEREHVSMCHLMNLLNEMIAMRAYAGLANSELLNAAQLADVRKEIVAMPDLALDDAIMDRVQAFQALDMMMMCIRGNSQPLMRVMALELNSEKTIDIGDWADADWDVALREVVRIGAPAERPATEKSFAQRLAEANEKAVRGKAEGEFSALDPVMDILDTGKFEPGTAKLEQFLKRRAGESREAFTRRVTRWLMGGTAADAERSLAVDERPRVYRVLALTAVRLAEYRLARGEYPESLEKLVPAPQADSFSDKPLCYRREDTGYTLWSVGMNQKDDGGSRDDYVIKAEKWARYRPH